MKKKIKAFFLAILLFFISFYNSLNVSASVPGVVQAENVWLMLETLALSFGVNLDFIPDKSISYNNEFQKNSILNNAEYELEKGIITQQQYDDIVSNIDTIVDSASNQGVGSVISIGEDLFNSLSRYFYNDYFVQNVDLTSFLGSDALSVWNAYEGKCAIYRVFVGFGDNPNYDTIIAFGNGVLQNPIKFGNNGSNTIWYLNQGSSGKLIYNSYKLNSVMENLGNNNTYEFLGSSVLVEYHEHKMPNEVVSSGNDGALSSFSSYSDYYDNLSDKYDISDGSVVISGSDTAPVILDGDTIADTVSDIQDGTITWDDAISDIYTDTDTGDIETVNPVIGKKALDEMIQSLDLDRLETKFPFCIPNDLMLIMNGATSVSSNQAPVIEIPLRIEFNEHVYYDNDRAVVIDFNDFSGVVAIFREGFFLLFLIALLWVSIDILQAFFVVTE